MIVVIQRASRKARNAGHLVTADGQPVTFVAHPEMAPKNGKYVYARPDEDSGNGKSWRDVLLAYNRKPSSNPLALLPAFQLYENPVYELLVQRLGVQNMYILSAGWGLIRSDFVTPDYDITFSPSARGADAKGTDTTTSACCARIPKTTSYSSVARITCRCSAL